MGVPYSNSKYCLGRSKLPVQMQTRRWPSLASRERTTSQATTRAFNLVIPISQCVVAAVAFLSPLNGFGSSLAWEATLFGVPEASPGRDPSSVYIVTFSRRLRGKHSEGTDGLPRPYRSTFLYNGTIHCANRHCYSQESAQLITRQLDRPKQSLGTEARGHCTLTSVGLTRMTLGPRASPQTLPELLPLIKSRSCRILCAKLLSFAHFRKLARLFSFWA